MKKLVFILLATGLLSAQLSFQKIDGLRWNIDLSHVIVQLKAGATAEQLTAPLAAMNGSVVRQLNKHRFYLVTFRNFSKTTLIFGKQIDKLRRIQHIADVLPVMQFSEKLVSTDVYLNSQVGGFSTFQNDSLFKEINALHFNFNTCYDKKLRLNRGLVKFALVEFEIDAGRSKNLRFLDTDIEDEELVCVRRVLNQQFWVSKKAAGKVRFLFIIKNER